MNKDTLRKIAPSVLRIGISLVFIWFGTQQLMNTQMWVRLIPQYAIDMTGLSNVVLVHINGAFEIVFGTALLLGLFTRVTAFILAIHMIDIVLTVGYTSIGVRDFGLATGTISVFLYGADMLSIDRLFFLV